MGIHSAGAPVLFGDWMSWINARKELYGRMISAEMTEKARLAKLAEQHAAKQHGGKLMTFA